MHRFCICATALVAAAFLIGCGSADRAADPASAAPLLTLSTPAFDFGPDVTQNPVVRTVATLSNLGDTAASIAPSLSGDAAFALQAGRRAHAA